MKNKYNAQKSKTPVRNPKQAKNINEMYEKNKKENK